MLPRNSCRVKGAGMRIGLSASSGIPAGIGRAARIECRTEILCSGSLESDRLRVIYKVVHIICRTKANGIKHFIFEFIPGKNNALW